MTTINERLQILVNQKTNGNVIEFERNCNLRKDTLKSIVGKRQSKPSFDTLELIFRTLDRNEILWLVTGEENTEEENKTYSNAAAPIVEYGKPENNDNLLIFELKKQNTQQLKDIEWYKQEMDKKQTMIDILLSGSVTVQKNVG